MGGGLVKSSNSKTFSSTLGKVTKILGAKYQESSINTSRVWYPGVKPLGTTKLTVQEEAVERLSDGLKPIPLFTSLPSILTLTLFFTNSSLLKDPSSLIV